MARRARPAVSMDPDLSALGVALADPSRLSMLDALLDGRAHPVGALAKRIGVTAATASGHVQRLEREQLVAVARIGRQRLVRLARPEVAQLLEAMARLAPPSPAFTAHAGRRARELRFARTCYDHLAGIVGVRIAAALVERGWLVHDDDAFTPAPALGDWLASHDVAVAESRRPLALACLDWSERVPHVAGRIGAAIAELCLGKQWLVRTRDSRAVRLTDRGRQALSRELGAKL
ncbi:MAG TPA: winged helix-turn-helix domain-containing protein [Kofleriaceae bacterium]